MSFWVMVTPRDANSSWIVRRQAFDRFERLGDIDATPFGHQPGDGGAVAGDDDFLPMLDAIEQGGETGLGVVGADGGGEGIGVYGGRLVQVRLGVLRSVPLGPVPLVFNPFRFTLQVVGHGADHMLHICI